MEQKSLQDLLKVSLKLSDDELRDWPDNYDKMDDERRQWLKDAIENVIKNDDVHKLRAYLEFLKFGAAENVDASELEEKSKTLEGIQLLLESDHNATDLHLLGGLKVVADYLSSPYSSLRWRAAEIIADATQNKPICQLAFTDLDGIMKLVEILKSDDLDIVKIKALYALSCVTRHCKPAFMSFLCSNGLEALVACMKGSCLKLIMKASFMLINVIADDERIVSDVVSASAVSIILDQLKCSHNDSHEHLSHLLYEIILRNREALLQCQASDDEFFLFLSTRRNELYNADKDKHQEEIFHFDEIIRLCCDNKSLK